MGQHLPVGLGISWPGHGNADAAKVIILRLAAFGQRLKHDPVFVIRVKTGPCRATGQRGADVAQRSADTKVRIKGDELAVLLAAVP